MHILSDTKALHHSLIGLFPLAIYKMMAQLPLNHLTKYSMSGFPGGAAVENLPADAGNTGSSPGLGRSHMPRSN